METPPKTSKRYREPMLFAEPERAAKESESKPATSETVTEPEPFKPESKPKEPVTPPKKSVEIGDMNPQWQDYWNKRQPELRAKPVTEPPKEIA